RAVSVAAAGRLAGAAGRPGRTPARHREGGRVDMNAWLADAHFLRPWWLLLVLAWGPLLWLGMRRARRGEALRRLVDARLLPHLLDRGGKGGRAGWLWWT